MQKLIDSLLILLLCVEGLVVLGVGIPVLCGLPLSWLYLGLPLPLVKTWLMGLVLITLCIVYKEGVTICSRLEWSLP